MILNVMQTALKPGRLEKQAHVISKIAGLNYQRLLQWIFAYAGLSAAWHFEEGSNADLVLEIAERCEKMLLFYRTL